ncbi:MAG: SulP family inorganic anion transporter, partial [Gammaproteobacteria bacterium]|nr:SulP family inorganic anion transporter [Gammaproteobacteria bacterium]
TRTYHKSDRELIGQGIGNTIAGLFGGLPGAGATMRTVVNVKAGGLTPLSGALHAIVLLIIVLGAGDMASNIPKAVLAGILVKVGTDIIDWDYLRKIRNAPFAGISVMLVVLGMTVFVDLIMAVATGMMMVSLIFMKRMTDLQLKSFQVVNSEKTELPLNDNERNIMCNAGGRILLYSFGGVMMFSAAKGMIKLLANYKDYDVLILDVTNVPAVDFTSCKALSEIISDAKKMQREVLLAGTRTSAYDMLLKQGTLRLIPEQSRFVTREEALIKASESVKSSGIIED